MDKVQVLTLSRGLQDDNKTAYAKFDGVLFRNSFKVDRAIQLVGVSFFGIPQTSKISCADFLIYIVIEEKGPSYNNLDTIKTIFHEKTFQIQKKKKGENMIISFPPVSIQPGVWVDIGFQIEGPETGILKLPELSKLTKYSTDGVVKFDLLRGSRQMPEIHFTLP